MKFDSESKIIVTFSHYTIMVKDDFLTYREAVQEELDKFSRDFFNLLHLISLLVNALDNKHDEF